MKRKLFVLFVVVAMLLAGCASTPATNSSAATSPNSTTFGNFETPATNGGAATSPNSTTSGNFEIPGTLSAENFDIKIVSAEICESITLDVGGIDVPFNAEEGKKLLVLSIDATNKTQEIRNLGSFITYVDGVTVLPSVSLGKYGERLIFVGAVHPGKTMCTYTVYQVPAEWKEFELAYVDSLTASSTDTVKIARSSIK